MTGQTDATSASNLPVTAFIGLGANLNEPQRQVNLALERLSRINQTRLSAHSSLYRSAPMGPPDQADYINAVAQLETTLAPLELLDELQAIEQAQGRVRQGERWGPRTLDLDMLLYNNRHIAHPRLTVPHYGLRQRNFVLIPLAEISPDLRLPDGTQLQELLALIDQKGIERLDQ